MKRFTLILLFAGMMASASFAQATQNEANQDNTTLTYRQVDEVRNALGLDHKQFEKVYKAYQKYNKEVFGSEEGPRGRGGMGPGGPRGGQGHRGPGMGGGRPDGPRDGAPRADRGRNRPDPEKLEKTMKEQEEKLQKSMQKLLPDTAAYNHWMEIRTAQLAKQPRRGRRPAPQQGK